MPQQPDSLHISALVGAMVKSYETHHDIIKYEAKHQISRERVLDLLTTLQDLLFAGFFGKKPLKRDSVEYYVGEKMEYLLYNLQKQIVRALRYEEKDEAKIAAQADEITRYFLERLPKIRAVLATDVDATLDGDPAAGSKDEIVLAYPGIYAIMVNRLAHELYTLGVPFIPRMMTEHAHSLTGIDIHPGASIGHHFFLDHGTGIVIGETTRIGNYVKIYQGVTLGALSVRGGQLLHGVKRHPTLEDHVTIYSGASIFGGATVIGEGVIIGSNVFITRSVPDKTKVSLKNPELHFMEDKEMVKMEFAQQEFFDYII